MGIRFFLHATPDLSKMVKFRRWAMAALSFFLSFFFFGEKRKKERKKHLDIMRAVSWKWL